MRTKTLEPGSSARAPRRDLLKGEFSSYRAPRSRRLLFESDIPADHPEKAAIEARIRESFDSEDGAWRVGVLLVQGTPWWIVFVEEIVSGVKRSALLDSRWLQRASTVKRIVDELKRERRATQSSAQLTS